MELIIAILLSLGVYATPVQQAQLGESDEITNADKRANGEQHAAVDIVVPDPREF